MQREQLPQKNTNLDHSFAFRSPKVMTCTIFNITTARMWPVTPTMSPTVWNGYASVLMSDITCGFILRKHLQPSHLRTIGTTSSVRRLYERVCVRVCSVYLLLLAPRSLQSVWAFRWWVERVLRTFTTVAFYAGNIFTTLDAQIIS